MVAIVGAVVLLAGLAMAIGPGPAVIVIPLGLAIWATEFDFADRWLQSARARIDAAASKARNKARNRTRSSRSRTPRDTDGSAQRSGSPDSS